MNVQKTIPKSILVTDLASPKIGHDVDNVFTLPDAQVDTSFGRTVMWHGPDPIGSGERSEVLQAEVLARGVTVGVPTPAGAALAGTSGAHTTQTGVEASPVMAHTTSLNIGDVTHALSYQTTAANMNWVSWRTCVARVGRHGTSAGTLDEEAESSPTDSQGFEIVKLARTFVRLNDANRAARKDTSPSQSTLNNYKKKCRQIDREISQLNDMDVEPLLQVMGLHAEKRQSFTAIKSALKHRAIARIQLLLRSQNLMQKKGDRKQAWKKHILQLHRAMKDFIEIDALDRQECLDFVGKRAERAHSKRSDLPHLPAGWQERFQDIIALNRQYQDAGLLLLHCGLRPVELAKGVRLRATAVGIEVHILGGKTRETAGQPWRSFVLDSETLPESFVDRVQINGEITVSADPERLRSYLHRLSDPVFLQGKYRPKDARKKHLVLSAYTFRHSVVTALRDSGWDTESIASAIGESSAQTVAFYGTRSRVGSRAPRKSTILKNSVQAARPVRGVDMNGLQRVLSRKAGPVKRKAHLHPRPGP